MFSGIVEELGEVVGFDGERLEIKATEVLQDLEVSESINVSGACLTVIESLEGGFVVEVVPETVLRTNFSELTVGGKVNLERSLRFGGRVGGHIVQGHVDGLAEILSMDDDGNSIRIWFRPPEPIMKYIVEKGFIGIDGISLTVVDVTDDSFSIAIIPYTREHTTLGERNPGDSVNIEVDITAKYLEKLAKPHADANAAG
ncbi:MAG: riboflavin synthase [Chloroflexi bacterium]|nr:riboflavin synthase [Chloroflexota bacterium]